MAPAGIGSHRWCRCRALGPWRHRRSRRYPVRRHPGTPRIARGRTDDRFMSMAASPVISPRQRLRQLRQRYLEAHHRTVPVRTISGHLVRCDPRTAEILASTNGSWSNPKRRCRRQDPARILPNDAVDATLLIASTDPSWSLAAWSWDRAWGGKRGDELQTPIVDLCRVAELVDVGQALIRPSHRAGRI